MSGDFPKNIRSYIAGFIFKEIPCFWYDSSNNNIYLTSKHKNANKMRLRRHYCWLLDVSKPEDKNLKKIWHRKSVQRNFFNLFLNNSSEHLFFKSKCKFSHSWIEQIIIFTNISSKGREVSEVLSILPHILLNTFRLTRLKYTIFTSERR